MTYKFKYKRNFFWRTIKGIKGHSVDSKLDRMDIFLEDGIFSIAKWSEYDMKLGSDFLLFQQQEMSKEAGQPIQVQGVK